MAFRRKAEATRLWSRAKLTARHKRLTLWVFLWLAQPFSTIASTLASGQAAWAKCIGQKMFGSGARWR